MYQRIIQTVVVLLLLSGTLGAQTQKRAGSEDPNQLFARAVQLHQSGDLEGAVREYQNFLALRPERVDARSNLGAALARLGRLGEAIEQYKRALNLERDNHPIRFNLAVAYYKTARFNDAAVELEIILTAQAENKNARFLLADCRLRMGEYKRVIELLAPLEASSPDDKALAYMLGLAYINERQVERGQLLIDRILRDGDSAEAHMMMGTTYLVINENDNAVKEFKRAAEINPKLPMIHSLQAQTLMQMGATDEAAQAYRRELENSPYDFNAILQLGVLLKQDQKLDEARAFFERALIIRPQEPNSRFYIASIDVAQGKMELARTSLEALVKDAPDFVEAHVMLATVYYRLKRKADGDREQVVINKLNAERQAKQPGAKQ